MTAAEKCNIVLIGFMGSGKTVIGRQAARLLNFDFADTDDEITQVTGLTLPQLFRKHGEIRFRSEERLVIQQLARRERMVIACGGSLLPARENLGLLLERGWFVLLTADPEIIKSRISRKNDRLLVGGKPTAEGIAAIMAERESQYAQLTDFVIDSGRLNVEEAAEAIVAQYRASQGKS